MKIYAVVMWKGGVGKTTTTIHLAHGLAMKLAKNGGGRVLVIDTDPQGNVAKGLGIRPKAKTIGDFLLGKCQSPKEVIVSADRVADEVVGLSALSRPGLFVLPADHTLVDAKEEMKDRATRGRKLIPIRDFIVNAFDAFPGLLDNFDYVIVDCPPAMDAFRDAIYHFVDACIMPVEASYLSSVGAVQQLADIIDAHDNGMNIVVEHVVPTKYVEREILSRRVMEDLCAQFGASTVSSPVPDTVTIDQAQSLAMTLFEYAPKSAAAVAYGKLVEKVYHDR